MEQAKEKARELIEKSIKPTEEHMDNLKPEINNLLHQYLPDDITIKEADILAMVINDIIWNPKKYLNCDYSISELEDDLVKLKASDNGNQTEISDELSKKLREAGFLKD